MTARDAATARRQQIVEAAVAIADRDGLAAVSIRRVAEAIGTRPMNLYTYVRDKDDLLERMAERAVSDVLVREPLPGDWRAAVEAIVTRSHEALTRHPWIVAISRRRRDNGPSGLRHAEQLLTAIAPLALEAADAWEVLFLINDYALGHALRVAHAPPKRPQPHARYPAFDAADYPRLARALSAPGPERDLDSLLSGLRTLLDGVEHRYGERTEPAAKPRG